MKPIILCVDDEKIILDSLKAQLKSAFGRKYYYKLAENGTDALELIKELKEKGSDEYLFVIISDWLMPGMKGDELLIKIHEQLPKSIKVMLTGQVDDEAIQRAISKGNLHKCFKKPWVESDLIECIRSAITPV